MDGKEKKKLWKRINDKIMEISDPAAAAEWNKTIEGNIRSIDNEKGIIYIEADDFFSYDLLKRTFQFKLKQAIKEVTNSNYMFQIVMAGDEKSEIIVDKIHSTKEFYVESGLGIIGENKFENYVISNANKNLYKACYTVSHNPNGDWSPLFIYGNSGTGKTHLLQSIGYEVLTKIVEKKVIFIDSGRLIKEVQEIGMRGKNKINATIGEEYEKLKEKYYQYDVLLIDDIQFISSKDKTKEILFSIFNWFIDNKKQIVVASDVPAEDLNGFESRFITRFRNGLSFKVSPPDVAAAREILKRRLAADNKFNQGEVEDEVIDFIAQNFSTDVRSLEGALTSLVFWAITNDKQQIELKDIKQIFAHIKTNYSDLDHEKILREVSNYYNITKADLRSNKRDGKIVLPRHIAVYLMRDVLDLTFSEIGKQLGDRNHSTIMTSYRKISKGMTESPSLNKAVQEIREKINK